MTYDVFGGTLSLTQSINQSYIQVYVLLCSSGIFQNQNSADSVVRRWTAACDNVHSLRRCRCHDVSLYFSMFVIFILFHVASAAL